ncbi:MAG: M23 family metallopeptidase [Candidatus Diapherotrites archaeon]|nr:M23 family metallopeptidase [Candidatus Diapherotrites archaeon]
MAFEISFLIETLVIAVVCLVIPLAFVAVQFLAKFKSRLGWLSYSLATFFYTLFVFVDLFWPWVSMHSRYAVMVLALAAPAYVYFKKIKKLNFKPEGKKRWVFACAGFLAAAVFLFISIHAISAYFYPADAKTINLEFPLRGGAYYVSQGGSNNQLNMHFAKLQKYAYDILMLDAFGFRAKGIGSQNLEDYYIYKQKIFAPCSGRIIEANNNALDMPLGQKNSVDFNGNYVVVECEGARVLMAHFLQGSVLVKANDQVSAGQEIGLAGNSGNTLEPHLHISADDGSGNPVVIEFDGKTLARNSVVVK